MCRKTLEGICVRHGVKERNLVKSLEKMKIDGIIDERLFEWADVMRHAGNDAAHDVNVENGCSALDGGLGLRAEACKIS